MDGIKCVVLVGSDLLGDGFGNGFGLEENLRVQRLTPTYLAPLKSANFIPDVFLGLYLLTIPGYSPIYSRCFCLGSILRKL
jgi:hypothetical protein